MWFSHGQKCLKVLSPKRFCHPHWPLCIDWVYALYWYAFFMNRIQLLKLSLFGTKRWSFTFKRIRCLQLLKVLILEDRASLKAPSSAFLISRYILRLGQAAQKQQGPRCPNPKMYLEIRRVDEFSIRIQIKRIIHLFAFDKDTRIITYRPFHKASQICCMLSMEKQTDVYFSYFCTNSWNFSISSLLHILKWAGSFDFRMQKLIFWQLSFLRDECAFSLELLSNCI